MRVSIDQFESVSTALPLLGARLVNVEITRTDRVATYHLFGEEIALRQVAGDRPNSFFERFYLDVAS